MEEERNVSGKQTNGNLADIFHSVLCNKGRKQRSREREKRNKSEWWEQRETEKKKLGPRVRKRKKWVAIHLTLVPAIFPTFSSFCSSPSVCVPNAIPSFLFSTLLFYLFCRSHRILWVFILLLSPSPIHSFDPEKGKQRIQAKKMKKPLPKLLVLQLFNSSSFFFSLSLDICLSFTIVSLSIFSPSWIDHESIRC